MGLYGDLPAQMIIKSITARHRVRARRPLIAAWEVAALIPDIPHPVLTLLGEQGTAKSTAARLLTSLIDRCAAQLRTAPHDVTDWAAVACTGSWVTALDNISDIPPRLSDAICRAVTGDGLLRRELYTTSDVSVLAFRRVIALTMIDVDTLSGDLAERLLSIELQRIDETERRHEQEIMTQWRLAQPAVLGGLLDLTAAVLMRLPRSTWTRTRGWLTSPGSSPPSTRSCTPRACPATSTKPAS